MSITAVIDHEEYIWGNGGVFLIGGWCVPAKGEQIEIRMLADGKVSLPAAFLPAPGRMSAGPPGFEDKR